MQRNTQSPEKQDHVNGGLALAVNSIFYTIQGEGPFAGSPAVFVRLAGCNLQCPMCDTEYTKRTHMSVQEIFEEVTRCQFRRPLFTVDVEVENIPMPTRPTDLVVITGGEPFRQNIGWLVRQLICQGYRVQIETNGTLFWNMPDLGSSKLTIVCSPKAGAINKKLLPYINAFKYVANVDSLKGTPDGLPRHALDHPNGGGLARPPEGWRGDIFLQPVDEYNSVKNNLNLTAVVKSCFDWGYRLCLQQHKQIGVD